MDCGGDDGGWVLNLSMHLHCSQAPAFSGCGGRDGRWRRMMVQVGPICPAHEAQAHERSHPSLKRGAAEVGSVGQSSTAVASLPFFPFFFFFPFHRIVVDSKEPGGSWWGEGRTRRRRSVARTATTDQRGRSRSLPMAYRRKQGGAVAADERRSSYPQDSASSYSYTSFKSMDEPNLGLWGTLARKAKGMLDEDGLVHKFEDLRREPTRSNPVSSTGDQAPQPRWSFENHWKSGDAASRIRPEALSASVNQLGGRIRNAFEEGLTIVDHKTSSIIQETKKIQIRKKPASSTSSFMPNSAGDTLSTPNQTFDQTTTAAEGTRLKASRDVANAMAAKAKLLLRELKSVKADLAFAKQRCAQLEEENKLLREIKQKGSKTEEDDDLIRVQLETLLAEKSRLAQENSTYARENRFLREIVEFHQFTTHEVLSVDDGDIEDDNQEQDSNLICTENELPIVEEELSHVSLDSGKPSSPKFSNSHSVVDSPNNISEQLHHHLSDTA